MADEEFREILRQELAPLKERLDKIEALTSGIPLLNRKLRDLTIRMGATATALFAALALISFFG